MSTTGRVLTAHLELESRQHELFGFDLGEGPPRRALVFGLVIITAWCALWAPFLGFPSKYTFSWYFLPPMLLTILGMRRSPRTARRRWLTDWALALRYAVLGHRPVIRWGARTATRRELIPLGHRLAFLTRARDRLWPAAARPAWADSDDTADDATTQSPVYRPLALHQRTRLVGGQHLHDRIVMKGKAAR